MRYIDSLVGIFLNLIQIPSREFYSRSLILAITILETDQLDKEKDNQIWLKKLEDIRMKTHVDLNIPLAKAEAIIDSSPIETWGKALDIKDNDGRRIMLKGREATILDVYQRLKESYLPMLQAVSNVAKDYSMDIRFRFGGGDTSMPSIFENDKKTN